MKKSRLFNLALLLVCVLCVQTSRAQDDNPFNLPEGARARLGKGAINGGWDPVAYSSDGTRLAVASDLGIWLYDAHASTELALLTDHITRVSSVVFAPDGKTIASASSGETIQLWNVDSRTLKNTLEGHTDIVSSMAFAPDGKTLASASSDQTVRLWDVETATTKKYTARAYRRSQFGGVCARWANPRQRQLRPDDSVVGCRQCNPTGHFGRL